MRLGTIDIDDTKIAMLCRATVRECGMFYTDPENVRRFEEWKAKRDAERALAAAAEVEA